MLVDTHLHLDLMENMRALISELSTPVVGVIAVGTTPRAYERELAFARGAKGIRVALGLHPQLMAERASEIELFMQLVGDASYIGEVGLDFGKEFSMWRREQVSCFERIARRCAELGDKTISVHSVRAAAVVLEILEARRTFDSCRCILHWFTGTSAQRRRAIEAGAYFSINPRMTKTKAGIETIRTVPLDRLLLESDAPFTMRFGGVGELRKTLEGTVDTISTIRGQDVSRQIEENSNLMWCDADSHRHLL